MRLLKPNFKFAEPLAGLDDIYALENQGIQFLVDSDSSACLKRLCNSGLVLEGIYHKSNLEIKKKTRFLVKNFK